MRSIGLLFSSVIVCLLCRNLATDSSFCFTCHSILLPSTSFPIHHSPYDSVQENSMKQALAHFMLVSCMVYTSMLKSRGHIFLRNVDWISRCYIPEKITLYNQGCENLKTYIASRLFWRTDCSVYKFHNNKREMTRSSGKNWSRTFLDTTRATLKMTRPTILLLLRVYSLPR
jgi:hypothetical protein